METKLTQISTLSPLIVGRPRYDARLTKLQREACPDVPSAKVYRLVRDARPELEIPDPYQSINSALERHHAIKKLNASKALREEKSSKSITRGPCKTCGSTERNKYGKCVPCRRASVQRNKKKARDALRSEL